MNEIFTEIDNNVNILREAINTAKDSLGISIEEILFQHTEKALECLETSGITSTSVADVITALILNLEIMKDRVVKYEGKKVKALGEAKDFIINEKIAAITSKYGEYSSMSTEDIVKMIEEVKDSGITMAALSRFYGRHPEYFIKFYTRNTK